MFVKWRLYNVVLLLIPGHQGEILGRPMISEIQLLEVAPIGAYCEN